MRSGVRVAGSVSAALMLLSACGTAGPGASAGAGYPRTVQNCGRDVRLDRTPERVVALGPSEVTSLYAAGGARKLVGRDDAGRRSDPYPDGLRAAVAGVPQLGTGGEPTRESLIALSPDLVVGSVSETITPQTLDAVGVPMISLRGNCGSNHAPGASDGTADFDDVYSDVTLFGRLLGTSGAADASVASLRQRVSRATSAAELRGRSAATLIVFDNAIEIYGRRSMAHTQFRELGARDAFGDTDSRVFEAGIEELTARDPDIVMLLSYGETDAQAKEKFLRVPGAANLRAVRDNALFVQPYEYSSQGVLSVDGLENMSRRLANLG